MSGCSKAFSPAAGSDYPYFGPSVPGAERYYVKLEDGKAVVAVGDVESPDATITQDYETAKGISTGELSAVAAYMARTLSASATSTVKGNASRASPAV